MTQGCARIVTIVLVALAAFPAGALARRGQQSRAARRDAPRAAPRLGGVYRINVRDSDKLYSVVAGAFSSLPFGEQQRFFIDLAVRLTPPDLIAIERRGNLVTIGSSRAPRITLSADGSPRFQQAEGGRAVRSRTVLEGEKLIFTSSGRAEDNFSVIFAPLEGGRRLRITRSITAESLSEPVIIQTVYDKVSDVARWDIYGETQAAREGAASLPASGEAPSPAAAAASADAGQLRGSLNEWVEATNSRDIARQMTFYLPTLKAFYLTRNVSRAFVRKEKAGTFAKASLVDIRAEEPEIIFLGGGRLAVMRFRKRYRIQNGSRVRSGAVIQELRWQRTGEGWKIFSERDIRVLE